MNTLTLHGEIERTLAISVHGFERDAAEDLYDANWLRCSVEVEQARFGAAWRPHSQRTILHAFQRKWTGS